MISPSIEYARSFLSPLRNPFEAASMFSTITPSGRTSYVPEHVADDADNASKADAKITNVPSES